MMNKAILLAAFYAATPAIHAQSGEQVHISQINAALHSDKWKALCSAIPGVAHGENPVIETDEETTTLGELVVLMRCRDILKNMLRVGLKPSKEMMQLAADMGNISTFKQMLEAKKDADVADDLLLQTVDIEILRLLLDHGHDPNVRDSHGRVALMLQEDPELLKLLLEKGADVNARDRQGRNALVYQQKPECLEVLITHRADTAALDHTGHSPIDYFKENVERQKILAAAGSEVAKPLDVITLAHWNETEVLLRDLDEHGYLITSEMNAETGKNEVRYFFASRSPEAFMKSSSNWDDFLEWLKSIPEGSYINHYEKCLVPFAFPEEWMEEHNLTSIFESLKLIEGEDRTFCTCPDKEEKKDHK